MNAILAIPLELRLLLLFILGTVVGSFLNLCIYRLAYDKRLISPWSSPPPRAAERTWRDRIPVIGWFSMRRETPLHGPRFWIRPMLIEVALGLSFAALYWWELQGGLLSPLAMLPPDPRTIHLQFSAHLLLLSLMLVATFIDIDEKTIPDSITIPGTLAGLAFAAFFPWSLLPALQVQPLPDGNYFYAHDYLRLTTPLPWPSFLNAEDGLWLGLGCYWLWCIGLLPRPWRTRRGYGRALKILIARIAREPFSILIFGICVIGSIAIIACWGSIGGDNWRGLLTSLVGLAGGGLLIWLVRVIAASAMRREAMGFGDVTLMCMIGAFLGWQACLILFFVAAAAGLVIGVAQWVFTGDNQIPYGPFLCLGAAIVLVFWSSVWDYLEPSFELGLFIPAVVLACLAIMFVPLLITRIVSDWLFPDRA